MSTSEFDDLESEGGNFLSYIPAIIWQRKWLLIVPLILCAIAGIAAYFLLPTTYRSEAILLVESSQLPDDVMGAGATEMVDRRILRIQQQVLSRPGLIDLINRYELYQSKRAGTPLSEIIDDMRDSIVITPVADTAPSNANNNSTIAFSLSYDYSDPVKTQSVAQEITEQILNIDSSENSEQAGATEQFLSDQATGLSVQIRELENQIAMIKAQNGGVLANSGGISMMGGSSASYDVQIAALQRENSQLIAQRQTALGSAKRDPIIASAEAQLAAARAVYSDNHPDVIFARQRLEEAKQLANQNVEKLPLDNIQQQLDFNNRQIAIMRAAKSSENAQASATMSAQSRAPLVLQRIAQLQQQLDGLNEQYQTVSGRLLAAQAGVKAGNEQMGERLSIIDPAVIPEDPISPNWLLLIAGGIGAGLVVGLVLVFGVELILQPIRDPKTVANILGQPPLAVIPTLKSRDVIKSGSRFSFFSKRKESLG